MTLVKIHAALAYIKIAAGKAVDALKAILDPKNGTTARVVTRLVILAAAHFGLALDATQIVEVMGTVEVVLAALVKSKVGNTPEPPDGG